MADNLNKEEEDLLQSALSDAFSPVNITKVSAQPPATPASAPTVAPPAEAVPTASTDAGSAPSPIDEWKSEYDEHVAEWRTRSAEQRQKAEAERAKWEAVRAEKEKAGVDWKDSVLEERRRSMRLSGVVNIPGLETPGAGTASGTASVSGWESVHAGTEGGASPSVVDARDLVAGERQRDTAQTGGEPSASNSPPDAHSRATSEPDSSKHEKWEEIPSDMTSSFPSMTIPSDIHSPISSSHQLEQHHRSSHQTTHAGHHAHDKPVSATAAAFDSRLSTRTRVLAVASSLAINLLLPFVNGVMLGFGEIFAKNVLVGWLGWKVPGKNIATNVGVRARTQAVGSGQQPKYKVQL
ncbi:hypothetical protein BDW22DRAFT_1481573 [Trametopsis cervina]|nr:hypothetical protein BDW22DRAFT_1481573 [Trametopsis cervina]